MYIFSIVHICMIYKFTECRQNRRMISTEKCFSHNRRIRIILLNEMRDFQRIVIFVVLNRLQSIIGKIQSQGCQAGSILQRLSGLQAAATNWPTLGMMLLSGGDKSILLVYLAFGTIKLGEAGEPGSDGGDRQPIRSG